MMSGFFGVNELKYLRFTLNIATLLSTTLDYIYVPVIWIHIPENEKKNFLESYTKKCTFVRI